MLRKMLSQPKAWLGNLLAPASDPRQAFTSASPADRQQELLSQLRTSLAVITASKVRLSARAAEADARLPELEMRARSAAAGGRLDIARVTLQRRQLAAAELVDLRRQVEELESEEQRLGLVEQRVTSAIDAFRARQEMLAARQTAAEAQIRVGEALAGVSGEIGGLGAALEEAELNAERMEARAGAIDRLIGEGSLEGGAGLLLDAEAEAEVEAQLRALLDGPQP